MSLFLKKSAPKRSVIDILLFFLYVILYYAVPQYLWVKSPNGFFVDDIGSALYFIIIVTGFTLFAYKEFFGKRKKILLAGGAYLLNLAITIFVFHASFEITLLLQGGTLLVGILVSLYLLFVQYSYKRHNQDISAALPSILSPLFLGGLFIAADLSVMVEAVRAIPDPPHVLLIVLSLVFSSYISTTIHYKIFDAWK